MLLMITSTGHGLLVLSSTSMTLNNLEPPKLEEFFVILGCNTHFKSEFRRSGKR